jgi:hypothetical protein
MEQVDQADRSGGRHYRAQPAQHQPGGELGGGGRIVGTIQIL